MTPIADMVEQMLSGGIPPDAIVLAVRAVELAVQENTRASLPADDTAARRRAWDRDRKRKQKSGIPPEAESPSLIASSLSPVDIQEQKESKKESARSTGIPPEFHRTKTRKGPLPEGWKPNQRAFNLAVSLGLSVQNIEPQFRDYLASSGKQYLDYDAGFCNFIRNVPKFSGKSNGPDKTVQTAAANLVDRIAGFGRMPTADDAEAEFDRRIRG